jgi:hypothetical protein
MQNLRRHSFADAAPNYTNAVADDFFSHDGIAGNGDSHGYTAHAESHFIAHSSPSPTSLAIAVGSLPRD